MKVLSKMNIFTDKADAERRRLNSIQFWHLRDISEQKRGKDEDLNFILNEANLIQEQVNSDVKHSTHNLEYLSEVSANLVTELEDKFFKRLQGRIKTNNDMIMQLRTEYLENQKEDVTEELLKLKRLENKYSAMLDVEVKNLAQTYVNNSYDHKDDLSIELTKRDEINVMISSLKTRNEGQLAVDLRQAMLRTSADDPFMRQENVKGLLAENNFLKNIPKGIFKDSRDSMQYSIKDLVKVDMGIKDFKGKVR